MEFRIIKKDSVTSTNDLLKNGVKEFKSGTVISAKEQTAGRGRTGRSFFSPTTGLYFSVLLKDISTAPAGLTLTAATAVMKGIYEVFGIKTQVKWVNDIFLDGRKVCGILTEGAYCGDRLSYAVIGIGINLSTDNFPDEIKSTAGSLGVTDEKKDLLLEKILAAFSDEIVSRNYIDFYRKNCLTIGRKVKLLAQGEEYAEGTAIDVSENGGLVVKLPDGTVKTVSYGEAKITE